MQDSFKFSSQLGPLILMVSKMLRQVFNTHPPAQSNPAQALSHPPPPAHPPTQPPHPHLTSTAPQPNPAPSLPLSRPNINPNSTHLPPLGHRRMSSLGLLSTRASLR